MTQCPHCNEEIEPGTLNIESDERMECPHCGMNIIGWDSPSEYSADTEAFEVSESGGTSEDG